VPEVRLDLDFSPELAFYFGLTELFLFHDFEGYEKVGFGFTRTVDSAKLAFAECFAHVKVLDRPEAVGALVAWKEIVCLVGGRFLGDYLHVVYIYE
jgi:hypothetical protein